MESELSYGNGAFTLKAMGNNVNVNFPALPSTWAPGVMRGSEGGVQAPSPLSPWAAIQGQLQEC